MWSDMSSFTKPLAIDGDIKFPTHPSIIIKEKFSYVLLHGIKSCMLVCSIDKTFVLNLN